METFSIFLIIALIIFFVLAVVFSFLYFSSFSYLINPKDCPTLGAQYGVVQNQTGNILSTCIGLGVDPLSPECRFNAGTIYNAIDICANNQILCQAFTYNEATGEQIFVTTPLSLAGTGVVTYVKQDNSNRS
jgi:hypothetical protein